MIKFARFSVVGLLNTLVSTLTYRIALTGVAFIASLAIPTVIKLGIPV